MVGGIEEGGGGRGAAEGRGIDMAPMKLEIITAEREVYSDEVDVLVARH